MADHYFFYSSKGWGEGMIVRLVDILVNGDNGVLSFSKNKFTPGKAGKVHADFVCSANLVCFAEMRKIWLKRFF